MLKATDELQVDNDKVRVTQWTFAPGAETGEHIHEYDYVIIPNDTGKMKIIDPSGQSSIVDMNKGQSYFRSKGVHHNVVSINDFEFSFVEVELKQ